MSFNRYTNTELKELEAKLIADLEAVRRVIALNADPDLIRVSELLAGKNTTSQFREISSPAMPSPPSLGSISRDVIRQVIIGFTHAFKFSDVVYEAGKQYPGREIKPNAISLTLKQLRDEGRIKEVSPREGRSGATYTRI